MQSEPSAMSRRDAPAGSDPSAVPGGDPLLKTDRETISERATPEQKPVHGSAAPSAAGRSNPPLANMAQSGHSGLGRQRQISGAEQRRAGGLERTGQNSAQAGHPPHGLDGHIADGPPRPCAAPTGTSQSGSAAVDEVLSGPASPHLAHPPAAPADAPARPSLGSIQIHRHRRDRLPPPIPSPLSKARGPPATHGELAQHLLRREVEHERHWFDSADYALELAAMRGTTAATAL